MPSLPTGTVTLLFTDIEGSTRLARRLGDGYRELLATHRSLEARPEIGRAIRADGRATARRFVWPRVLDGYEAAWETAFALSAAAG